MMQSLLVEYALKVVLVTGATLLLLRMFQDRSAAERSWIGHAGLAASLLLPLAMWAGPDWVVTSPTVVEPLLTNSGGPPIIGVGNVGSIQPPVVASSDKGASPEAEALPPIQKPTLLLLYSAPAAILLVLTFFSLFWLLLLRRRARITVDPIWISALALAQNRMGYKHGTALLVSTDVVSPVSWGILRPVILLNEDAAHSGERAEAIIAHELAHIMNFDWVKLILARIVTALTWFNPLTWILARQCHQLREEAADDAVLTSRISSCDYAELLIGAAKHQRRGLLLAAHGVAPGRNSLKQRVARVLDTGLRRTPARLNWSAPWAAAAILTASFLAALTPVRALPDMNAADARTTLEGLRNSIAEPLPRLARFSSIDLRGEGKEIDRPGTVQQAVLAGGQPEAVRLHVNDDGLSALTQVRALPDIDAADAGTALNSLGKPTAGPLPGLARFSAVEARGVGTVILGHGAVQQVTLTRGRSEAVRFDVNDQGLLRIDICGSCGGERPVVEVTTPDIEAVASWNGVIHAEGKFPNRSFVALAANDGGEIHGAALKADQVAASANAGGSVHASARNELMASVSGGGTVSYCGLPKNVYSSVTSGGLLQKAAAASPSCWM